MKTSKQTDEIIFDYVEDVDCTKLKNPFLRTQSEAIPKPKPLGQSETKKQNHKKAKKNKASRIRKSGSSLVKNCCINFKISGFQKTELIQIIASYKDKKLKVEKELLANGLRGIKLKQGRKLSAILKKASCIKFSHWMVGEERIFSNSYNSIKNAFARMFPTLTCGLTISGSPELGLKCNLFEMDLNYSGTWLVLILGLEIGKIRLLFIQKDSVKDNILRESGEPDSVTVRRKFVNFKSNDVFGESICLEDILNSKDTFQIPDSSDNKDSNNYFMNTEFAAKEPPKGIETFKEEMIQGLGGVQYWKKYRYRLDEEKNQAEQKEKEGLGGNKLRLGSYMLEDNDGDDNNQQHYRNKSEQVGDNPRPKAQNTQFFIDLEVPTEVFRVFFTEFDFKEDSQINFDEHQQIPKVFSWDQSVVDCYMDINTKEVFRKKQFESRLKRLKSQFDNQRRASRVNDLHKSTNICRSKTEPLEPNKFQFQRKNTGGGTRNSMHQSIEDVSARLRKKDQDFEIFLLANGVRHFGLKKTLEWANQVLSQFWNSPDEKEPDSDFDIATGTLQMNLRDSSLVVRTNTNIYLCSIEKSFNLKRRPDFAAIENFIKGEILEKGSVCEQFLMNLILERTDTILKGKPKSLVLPKLKKGFNEFIYVYSRTIKTYKLDKWLDKMKRKKKAS